MTGSVRAVDLAEVLAARDHRVARQRELLSRRGRDGVLVSLTMVVPGPVKTSPAVRAAFERARAAAQHAVAARGWPVLARDVLHAPTGPEALLLLGGVDAADLKRELIRLEDAHRQGRLWDADVVTAAGPLSRTHVGAPARPCLVCAGPAAPCARSRTHTLPELLAAVDALLAAA